MRLASIIRFHSDLFLHIKLSSPNMGWGGGGGVGVEVDRLTS